MITSTAAEQRTQEIVKELYMRRLSLKMSRRALAAKLDTTDDVVYRWEKHRAKYIRLETLIQYAAVVGLDLRITLKQKTEKQVSAF